MYGRRDELRALTAAIVEGRSRLITGPVGIGKSRLVQEALSASGRRSILLLGREPLHALLVGLAQFLDCPPGRFVSLERATSLVLKPLVLEALARSPMAIVLEDVARSDARKYRFFQQAYYVRGVNLVVTAASRGVLGHLHKLLWDPREEIALKPLNRSDAKALFAAACAAFDLTSLDLGEFQGKVLASAAGNPGQILTMCRMAGRSEYQDGRYIKFLPLRMDALASFV
jgi:predicted ATPase